jgi:hypothetical protein
MKKVGIGGVSLALTLVFGSQSSVQAQEMSFLTADDLQVGGYSDFGRFQLHGAGDGEIIGRFGSRWSIDKPIDENFSVMAKLNWMFWRNMTPPEVALFHIAGVKFDSDVQAALTWVSGPDADGAQRAKVGLYDFKYSRDSRNLGEYLLRSEAYPTVLESSQGKDLLADSHTRVLGVEYGRRETALFNHTALFYAEQVSQPVYDLNLAYIAALGNDKLELGAGVAWARAVKVSDKDSNIVIPADRHAYLRNSDLTTEALKFSVRGRVEVLSLPRWNSAVVVYGEAALLGIQSDTLYYKNITERMPVMAGVSFPVPGVFTSVAVEGEYLKNPYGDKRYEVRYAPTALPALEDYAEIPNYTKDDWRWSVQAHRALGKWVDVKVRVASDHLRLRTWDGDYGTTSPMTQTSGDWYFLARVEFHN